jgi:hemerythrin
MIMHANSVNNLPHEDYQQIEEEHVRLMEVLNELAGTCCNMQNQLGCNQCSREKLAACKGQLTSFFYNLVNLAFNHFSHEESIMLKRPHVTPEYEYFRIHKQAHHAILLELDRAVNACRAYKQSGQTAEAYRQLHATVSTLFSEHDMSFDDPFIQSTQANNLAAS